MACRFRDSSRCALGLGLAVLAALVMPATALAEFPYLTLVDSGLDNRHPIGTAIRNWPQTGDTLLLVEHIDDDGTSQWLNFHARDCGTAAGCPTPAFVQDALITQTPYGEHFTHPTLSIRKATGSAPVEARIVWAEKYQVDCDGDGLGFEDGDNDDKKQADLWVTGWDRASLSFLPYRWVELDAAGGACPDVGVGIVRFTQNALPTVACYTFKPDIGDTDRVACNNDNLVWPLIWPNHTEVDNVGADEDHPGWDFIGPTSERFIASTWRGVGLNQIRVHREDNPAGPNFATFAGTTGLLDHASVYTTSNRIHLVWREGAANGFEDASATVWYSSCAPSAMVDCGLTASWDVATAVVDASSGFNNSAQFPQFVADGNRQFVYYQYDSKPGAGDTQTRVALASRCMGDPWGLEMVSAPSFDSNDQVVGIGRPGIVVNKNNNTVHVVYAEINNYTDTWSMSDSTLGSAFWARDTYDDCP